MVHSGGAGLPSGRVTFLFTDIEASTRLLCTLGEAYETLIDQHHATLRAVWSQHHGHEVNTEGDAFFVAFADAADALAAAATAQRSLAAVRWAGCVTVRVRMGLHTGFARPHRDDYAALSVHQAARVVGAAHGGQILCTSSVVEALDDRSSPVELRSLGRFRVRDFDDPPELLLVVAHGWDDPGRAPRARPAEYHNLVAPLTPMVDRQDERAWLAEVVHPGALVTVAGPGGGGKTRLAVEFGLDVAASWPDGVWFVDLAPVRTDGHVAEALADAVGAAPAPGRPPLEDAVAHLADREALLVLDNCEQVARAVALVAHDVLARCRSVAVLSTSRIPLGLRAERVLRLAPLPSSDLDSAAVELFLGLAGNVSGDELPVIRELCEQLDGLPLALELAAARTSALRPTAILERLHSSHDVVRTDDPTLPERHRSIDSVLDWSWDLLPVRARRALSRLAVPAGPFTIATATALCRDEDVAAEDVPELLWSLVDHSLVLADVTASGSRYRLLAPVRGHALARTPRDERRRTVRRLAEHLLARLGPDRATSRSWMSEMHAEVDNVRGVLRDLAHGTDDELGQSLAWSLGHHHDTMNAYATALLDLESALDAFPTPTPALVAVLTLLADVHLRVGDVDAAEKRLEEAESITADVGTPTWDAAGLLRSRGEVALRRNDLTTASDLARAGLRDAHDPRGLARCWNLLGLAAAGAGDLDAAVSAFEEELRAAEAGGLDTFLTKTHGNLAEGYLQLGDRRRGAHHQLACLELARAGGEAVYVAFSAIVAARLLAAADEGFRSAVELHEAAHAALAEAGYALYDADVEIRDQFRSQAARSLGADGYAAAADEGRRRDLWDVATVAGEILARAAKER